jgi:peptidyl-prolyl cis-trans isomerase D
MLDFIRRKSASTVVLFIFGIIILVFVFWGFNPGQKGSRQGAIATVNGVDISNKSYQNLYKRELEKIKEQAQGALTDEILENLQLDQRVLNMLINDVLIIEEAERQGIEATNEDVQAQILANPAFQKDGVFNKEFYLELLRQNRLNPIDYEASLRQNITAQKMWNGVVSSVTFTDEELWEKFSEANAEYSFDYVEFAPEKFMDNGVISEDLLKKFYEENKASFPVATTVKVFYARAGFDQLGKSINIADDDIKKYYEANTYDYLREAEVRARHILIKGEGAEKKAGDILARIKGGESFSVLAKKYSEDRGSAAKGGDLGFFGPGTMVKQFENVAFSLKEGEVSDLVKTSFGYHIIKTEEVREEGARPLSEVRGEIKSILIKAQAAFAARDSIESLHAAFTEKDDVEELAAIVSELSLESKTTGTLSEDATDGVLLADEGLKNAAFGLNAGGVSAPVETKDGVYLLKVLERVESHVATFEEANARVAKSYRREKSIEAAKASADDMLKRLADGSSFESVVKSKGLVKNNTGFLIRERAFIDSIGLFLGDKTGLFKLTADAPNFEEVIPHNSAFYVFKLTGSKPADRAAFDANKDAIGARYLGRKRAEAQNEWIESLREKAEISINTDLF